MISALQPYPAYKPSGVPWLGDVPEHWDVFPIKRIASFKSGAGFPVDEQGDLESELPFLKVSDMTTPGNAVWMGAAANTVSRETAARLTLASVKAITQQLENAQFAPYPGCGVR